MVNRPFWIEKIEAGLRRKSIVWLSGVRRAGKTVLSRSLPGFEYFDCELPRVRRMMDDPEPFLDSLKGKRAVLDEIHRLGNPSELLKIAADHYPSVRIIATGSSTLGASSKFRDTLTGRKAQVWLTPMVSADLTAFGNEDMRYRFLRGGLPPFFLPKEYPETAFQEWMDAFWAKDIQELFRLERHSSFQRFFELLMAQSGSIFEANKFAAPCEVSRQTIVNYLKVLESTFVMHVVRPFSRRKQNEIVSAPKVYGFDTGFVCYYRGWNELRREDLGFLWEHFVLNELYAHSQARDVFYWRDKRGHEMDFVLVRRGGKPLAVECKWSDADFDPSNALVFAKHYPQAEIAVVAATAKRPYLRRFSGVTAAFVPLSELIRLSSVKPRPGSTAM